MNIKSRRIFTVFAAALAMASSPLVAETSLEKEIEGIKTELSELAKRTGKAADMSQKEIEKKTKKLTKKLNKKTRKLAKEMEKAGREISKEAEKAGKKISGKIKKIFD